MFQFKIEVKQSIRRRLFISFLLCFLILSVILIGVQTDSTSMSENVLENSCYENIIAISFDDGPNEETTARLLDGLKERGVKASFFLVGENIEGNEDIVKRMYDEGHLVGNHTYTHVQLSKLSVDQAYDEIIRTNQLIESITGEVPKYIRPPYGSYSNQLLMKINMSPVYWSVDPDDWNTTNVSNVVKCVVKNAKPGDIILMHDIYDSSVTAALEIIDELQAKGYVFVTVDQLILD